MTYSIQSDCNHPLTKSSYLQSADSDIFEEGREKEEASAMQVLTKKDEPLVEALPSAPIIRKLRGKIILNTGRGG